MNYYQPLQRKDGRWDYVQLHNGDPMPVGYCAPYRLPPPDLVELLPAEILARNRQFCHKHHTDGHATAEEAARCYLEFLLDQRTDWNQAADHARPCRVCGALTRRYVQVGAGRIYMLCDAHRTREDIQRLAPVTTASVASSY